MRIKHIIAVHLLLTMVGVLLLCGCNQEGWSYKEGVCVRNARLQAKRFSNKGYAVRYGHGWVKRPKREEFNKYWDKDKQAYRHVWTERQLDNGSWVICRDTVNGYDGHEVSEYGDTYIVKRYRPVRNI